MDQPISDVPADGIPRFDNPVGAGACRQTGCVRRDGVRCQYIDGSGRRCPTTWCGDHRRNVGGVGYCRRHANTIVALGPGAHTVALPDIDNRGPSLVNWVFRDLDAEVRLRFAALTGMIARDPAVTVVLDPAGERRWERGWRLPDAQGDMHRVAVSVAAADDALTVIMVDGRTIANGVPPWIDRHRRGIDVTPDVDAQQRRIFYTFLMEHLIGVLTPRAAAARVS